jgi:signal recognition particle subunit SEC65
MLKKVGVMAKNLGYHAEIERGYKYPRTWWEDPGRVIVDAQGKKKNKIMFEIAKELRKIQLKT